MRLRVGFRACLWGRRAREIHQLCGPHTYTYIYINRADLTRAMHAISAGNACIGYASLGIDMPASKPISSHRMYQLTNFRKSTPSHNRQLIVDYYLLKQ